MEEFDKIEVFSFRSERSLISWLKSTMKNYGFTKISPFIRYILINFKNKHNGNIVE